MNLNGQRLSRLDVERRSGDISAVGGVRKVVLEDEPERGVRVLGFRTGTGLAFDILVDRAMDIGRAEFKGRSFGWCSPTGFRHPGLHENSDEHGLGWLRSFSGLLTTAGLDHTFSPAKVDASQYRYPSRSTMHHGLHGRVANTPAQLIGYCPSWEGDRCRLWAEGEIRQATVFGENLLLRRWIGSELGTNAIQICDTVRNCGFEKSPHMFLYHIDFGWPLIDEGTQVVAPLSHPLSRSSEPQQQCLCDIVVAPTPDFDEQAQEHELVADSQEQMRVAIINERLEFGVMVDWFASEFPCFIEWLHLREGAFVLGIEPSTHHLAGDQAARDDGSMIWLEHGQSRTYHTTISILDGPTEIGQALDTIRAT